MPICSVTLAGGPLPQVSECPYFGVTLTSSLSWVPDIRKLISRGKRLFAQCVSWCRTEHLPLALASNLFRTYVLPSVSCGAEFCSGSAPAVGRLLSLFGRITSMPIEEICALLWRLSRQVLLVWVPAALFSECESGALSVLSLRWIVRSVIDC